MSLGFFAVGEYIFAKGDERLNAENWMQLRDPTITVNSTSPIWSRAARSYSHAPVRNVEPQQAPFQRAVLENAHSREAWRKEGASRHDNLRP